MQEMKAKLELELASLHLILGAYMEAELLIE